MVVARAVGSLIFCQHSGACLQRDDPELYSGAEDEVMVKEDHPSKDDCSNEVEGATMIFEGKEMS